MTTRLDKLIYLGSTAAFSISMLIAVGFYFFDHAFVADYFSMLGYPSYLVYPLGIVKILGVIGIWSKKYSIIREWAYAGYFYNCTLAFVGNAVTPGGVYTLGAIIAIILLIVSYFYQKKIQKLEAGSPK